MLDADGDRCGGGCCLGVDETLAEAVGSVEYETRFSAASRPFELGECEESIEESMMSRMLRAGRDRELLASVIHTQVNSGGGG
jgi:hypothetical protein